MNNTELKNIVKQAIELKDKVARYQVVKSIYSTLGYFDKADRYYLNDLYQTESSNSVRTPSRAWPKSVYTHIYSTKYLKQLLAQLEQEVQV